MLARYPTLLKSLHYLLTTFIIIELFFGYVYLVKIPNLFAEKMGLLWSHMVFGGIISIIFSLIFFLMLKELLFLNLKKTNRVNGIENKIELYSTLSTTLYWFFNLLAIPMLLSGITIANHANLFEIILHKKGNLPLEFDTFLAQCAHAFIAKLMITIIIVQALNIFLHHISHKPLK